MNRAYPASPEVTSRRTEPSAERPSLIQPREAQLESTLPESAERRVAVSEKEERSSLSFVARLKVANREFADRVEDAVDLPIKVLLEQRDAVLRELSEQQQRATDAQRKLATDHERFVAFLMEEHHGVANQLREQVRARDEELQRGRALGSGATADVDGVVRDVSPAHSDELERLRTELSAAFAEVDETRLSAASLQEELDEAICATDDVRLELQGELDAARDETFTVQAKLDETLTELDDARDYGRDEAVRLNEELDEVQRQLDARNAEVRSLRQRLAVALEGAEYSKPPPPGASAELATARREVKSLRQELIQAKRQLSRAELGEGGRPRHPRPGPGTRARTPSLRSSRPPPFQVKEPEAVADRSAQTALKPPILPRIK